MSQPANQVVGLSSDTWLTVSFEDPQATWSLENGQLFQRTSTGSASNKSGTLLVIPDSPSMPKDIALLEYAPGKTYQSGLIFNYHDQDNFCLFVINNFSESYTGYKLLILEIQNGRATTIHEEKSEVNLQEDIKLVILQEEEKIIFFAEDRDVYQWQNKTIEDVAGIGFYSQNNQDTIFKELYIGAGDDIEDITEQDDHEPLEEGDVIGDDIPYGQKEALDELDIKTPFDPYLQIQPPNAQSQIEFREVFNVPLDSFYVSLFGMYHKEPKIKEPPVTYSQGQLVTKTEIEMDDIAEFFQTDEGFHIIGNKRKVAYLSDSPTIETRTFSSSKRNGSTTLYKKNTIESSLIHSYPTRDGDITYEVNHGAYKVDVLTGTMEKLFSSPIVNLAMLHDKNIQEDLYACRDRINSVAKIISIASNDVICEIPYDHLIVEIYFLDTGRIALVERVSGTNNRKLKIYRYSPNDYTNEVTLDYENSSVRSIFFSSDFQLVFCRNLNSVVNVHDTSTGEYKYSIPNQGHDFFDKTCSINQTNDKLVYRFNTYNTESELRVVDFQTGEILNTLATPSLTIQFIYFITPTKILYGHDFKLLIWDTATTDDPVEIDNIQRASYCNSVDVHPDGSEFLVQYGDLIFIFSMNDYTKRDFNIYRGNQNKFKFSDDGSRIYGKHQAGAIKVCSTSDGTLEEPDMSRYDMTGVSTNVIAVSENCKYQVVRRTLSGQPVDEILVWDSELGKFVYERLIYRNYLNNPKITEDGKLIHSFHEATLKIGNQEPEVVFVMPALHLLQLSKNNKFLYYNEASSSQGQVVDLSNHNKFRVSHSAGINICPSANPPNYFRSNPLGITYYDLAGSSLGNYTSPSNQQTRIIKAGKKYLISVSMMIEIWEVDQPGAPIHTISDIQYYFNTDDRISLHGLDLAEEQNLLLARSGLKQVSIWHPSTAAEYCTISTDSAIDACWFLDDATKVGILTNNSVEIYNIQPTPQVADDVRFAYPIDYRPKRWYRKFKIADDEERFHKVTSGNMMDLIDYENAIKTPNATDPNQMDYHTHEQIKDQFFTIQAYRNKYQDSINTIFLARDVKQSVIHELRSSGYLLLDTEERDVDDGSGTNTTVKKLGYVKNGNFVAIDAGLDGAITSKGYDFAIIKGNPNFRQFEPIPLQLELHDFNDHDDWGIFMENFRAKLFVSGALTEQQKKLFDSHLEELEKFEVNDILVKQKADLEKQLAEINARITQIEQNKASLAADKDKWQRDRQKFNTLLNEFNFGRPIITEIVDLYNKLKGQSLEKFQLRFEDYIRKSSAVRRVTRRFLFFKRTYTYTVVINYHTYKIFHPFKQFSSYNFGIQYKHTPVLNLFGFISFLHGYSNSALDYLHELMRICDHFNHKTDELMVQADADIQKTKNEKLFHENALANLNEFGLMQQRHKFVSFWNDPNQFGARQILDNVIRPDSDPLADLISDFLEVESDDLEIDVFNFVGDRYYTQHGMTLKGYLDFAMRNDKRRIALFPYNSLNGTIDPDIRQAVVNPMESKDDDFNIPSIKFVETHKILVTWNGFVLGELTHTENLFPSESKEITIERTTELIKKREESRLTSSTSTTKHTTSFEEKLTDEFSQKDTQEKEKEDSYETQNKRSHERDVTTESTDEETFNIGASVSGGIGLWEADVSTEYDKTKSRSTTDNRVDTHELSQTLQGKTSSKESRESFKKQVANTIKKVAQETTLENKVEVRVNSSEQYTATDSRKEIVMLENPNSGRTINYNFFQLQNNYEVKTILTDVKIVVDPNTEIIKDSGVSDVRVFELEEIGKILSSDADHDPQEIITAAITVRQAFKNYLEGVPGVGRGNGALTIESPFEPNMDLMEDLFFSRELDESDLGDQLIHRLGVALEYLKKVPFQFKEVEINPTESYTVNTGGYFLDAEVGKMSALEDFAEKEREVNLERGVEESNEFDYLDSI